MIAHCPQVVVSSRDDAPAYAAGCSHAVSFEDSGAPGTVLSDIDVAHHHHVTFDDIVVPRILRVGNTILRPPTRTGVQRVIHIMRAMLDDRAERVLIHCSAGRRRSPAGAYVLFALALGAGDEQEAWAATIRACTCERPEPNPLMCAYADVLLGREGRLFSTVWPDLDRDAWLSSD